MNTVGKMADKVVGEGLMSKENLFHERGFAWRNGRRAIDSVMLMDELGRETEGEVYGRDIKSAFNSLDRDEMREILKGHEGYQEWVDHFLRPRTFNIKVDERVIGKATMTGGTSGLSYIDDVNSVRVGKPGPMDEALEERASSYGLKWDRSKDWVNQVHLGVNINKRKHWKYRTGLAKAVFERIRRLPRLPPELKWKVTVGQLTGMEDLETLTRRK